MRNSHGSGLGRTAAGRLDGDGDGGIGTSRNVRSTLGGPSAGLSWLGFHGAGLATSPHSSVAMARGARRAGSRASVVSAKGDVYRSSAGSGSNKGAGMASASSAAGGATDGGRGDSGGTSRPSAGWTPSSGTGGWEAPDAAGTAGSSGGGSSGNGDGSSVGSASAV